MLVRVLADAFDETFAEPLGDAAADDDDLGIERVGQVAGEEAEVILRVAHDLAHDGVVEVERFFDHARGQRLGVVLAHQLRNLGLPALLDQLAHVALHGGARGERLDAAALAAAAARAVRQERHVADLAGDAAAAVVRVVADDDAAADAGADEDADHGARALADAVGVLADDGDADVVVEKDAQAIEAGGEALDERDLRPAEVGRGVDDAARVIDAAGDADAERAEVGGARTDLVADAAAERDHAVDDGVGSVGGERLGALGVDDVAVDVDGGGVHLGATEVEADD